MTVWDQYTLGQSLIQVINSVNVYFTGTTFQNIHYTKGGGVSYVSFSSQLTVFNCTFESMSLKYHIYYCRYKFNKWGRFFNIREQQSFH